MTESPEIAENIPPQATDTAATHWLARPGNQLLVGVMAIVVAGLLVYENTFRVPLQWDEFRLARSYTEGSSASGVETLSPLAALSVGLDARFSGTNALGYRVDSVALHLIAGILVFLIARRLLAPRAWAAWAGILAGLLFVLHPGATQAVDYLFARGSLLAGVLSLLSIWLYLRATGEEGLRATPLVISLGMFGLAWPAASVAAVVPPVVLLCDVARRRRIRIAVHGPYWALLGILIAIQLMGVRQDGAAEHSVHLVSSLRATTDFLQTVFVPTHLLVVHPDPTGSLGIWLWVVLAVCGVGLFWPARMAGLCVTWFALGIVAAGMFGGGFSEDRVYLPLAGLALVPAWIVAASPRLAAKGLAAGVFGLLALASAATTSTRNHVWGDETQLWADAADGCPACFAPAERLGMIRLHQALRALSALDTASESERPQEQIEGLLQAALAHLDQANTFPQAPAEIDTARAQALRLLNRPDEAEAALYAALEKTPRQPEALLGLAETYAQRSRGTGEAAARGDALRLYRARLETGSFPDAARLSFGELLLREGDLRGAVDVLQPLARMGETSPAARLVQDARARLQALQVVEAAYQQQKTAQQAAVSEAALEAQALYLEGHYQLADYVAGNALAAKPDDVDSWLMLGVTSAAQGAIDRFIAKYPQGAPGAEGAASWRRLARTCAVSGQWAAAEVVLRHVNRPNGAQALIELAELAENLRQPQRASAYLQQAAQEAPDNPAPWVQLAELALGAGRADIARQYIAQAEQRGASADSLAELKKRAGMGQADSLGLERGTIIR